VKWRFIPGDWITDHTFGIDQMCPTSGPGAVYGSLTQDFVLSVVDNLASHYPQTQSNEELFLAESVYFLLSQSRVYKVEFPSQSGRPSKLWLTFEQGWAQLV